MKWEPVSKLPYLIKQDEDYFESERLLVWVRGTGVAFGKVFTSIKVPGMRWRAESYIGSWVVTHWMYLPEEPSD